MRRYEPSDEEWAIIQPLLPNKSRGVPRGRCFGRSVTVRRAERLLSAATGGPFANHAQRAGR
jgi:transposase